MESRTDLVRLYEEMDKALNTKRKELAELDERLEVAREKVSQKEANEIEQEEEEAAAREQQQSDASGSGALDGNGKLGKIGKFIETQKSLYEKQLKEFAESLSELELMNQKLLDENLKLTSHETNKDEKSQQIESAYFTLSDQYQELYKENTRLRIQLAEVEAKSTEQQNQLDKSNQLDIVLEEVYNKKIDSLNKIIELKEEEIEQIRADNQFTLKSLGITSEEPDQSNSEQMNDCEPMDYDKRQRVIQIAATIREKDSQIESLKSQLQEATKELEKSALLLESVTNQSYRTRNVGSENQLSLTEQLNEVNKRCEELERELSYKDSRVTDLERRNLELTFLVPELVEETLHALALKLSSSNNSQDGQELIERLCRQLESLLDELRTAQEFIRKNEGLKNDLRNKDKQIIKLVTDLNQMHTQFNLAVRGVKSEAPTAVVVDMFSQTSSQDTFHTAHSRPEPTQSHQIEEEPSESMQDDKDEPDAREQEESNRNEAIPVPEPSYVGTTEFPPVDPYTCEKVEIDALVNLQRRLRLLEDENELLELAMKEILLCIRWSDSQCSTLLIDCPSLERLCQIIEARYIADPKRVPSGADTTTQAEQVQPSVKLPDYATGSETFQVVLLKSELDLVRGQNEQLRSDMKTLRRDYHEMLSNGADTAALHTTKYLSMKFAGRLSNVGNLEYHKERKNSNRSGSPPPPNAREVECQTELTLDSVSALVERVQSPFRTVEHRSCTQCKKSSDTINRLIEGIAKLETRVSICDDNYLVRFKHWNQLIQMLSRDLGESTESLKEVRKECLILRQQKYKAESKLEIIERQVVDHLKSCPKPQSVSYEAIQSSAIAQGPSNQSVTSSNGKRLHIESPATSTRVIITLLKSIVGCLQARLVFKDERIRHLENLIVEIKFCADPA